MIKRVVGLMILVGLVLGLVGTAEAGWLSGWDTRLEVTIDSSGAKVDSDLTHFPLPITISPKEMQWVDYDGMVYDVTVENHILLVRRVKSLSAEQYELNGENGNNQNYLNNFNSSPVVYTLSPYLSNSFNLFSLDHKPTSYPLFLNQKANAAYGTSLICGDNILDASIAKSLNLLSGTASTNRLKSSKTSLNSAEEILEYSQILSLFLTNSSIPNDGVYNSKRLKEVTNSLVVESGLKNENRIFMSTTSSIYNHPFFFHSLATPSLALSPSSRHSSSVSVEFFSILSNLLRSNSLTNLSRTTDFMSPLNSDRVVLSSLTPGILTTNSAISPTSNYNDTTIKGDVKGIISECQAKIEMTRNINDCLLKRYPND